MQDRVVAAIGDLYDIQAEVGRGGMAIVYRALDLRLKRQIAIKVLPPDLAFREEVRTRFLREAETAAQLSHPNIVPIYTVDERDGLVFFVMALVEGESLGARLARETRLPIAEGRRILRDVADALAYAHARGVIHRDIKPDNILLERASGRPMVTDFGIARAAEADSRLTVTGIAVGTPAYMSPEQALGDREMDGRSDIYSLGVVGYQLLGGELPFRATNTPAMMLKHVSEAPRPLRERRTETPPALAAAIERALAKRPDERWPGAGAFRDALSPDAHVHDSLAVPPREEPHESARAPLPSTHPAPPWPPSPSRRERRRKRRQNSIETFAAKPVEERIRIFRRTLVGNGATIAMLATINLLTFPFFWWFLFPAIPLSIDVASKAGSLWADGVRWRQIFGRGSTGASPAVGAAGTGAATVSDPAAELVGRDVLDGPHGVAVRRAITDRAIVLAIVDSLSKADRDLLPDVVPTVHALVQRTAALAQMLHHLHADVDPALRQRIESRIAHVEREPEEAADRERRLTLLRRQRDTLRDLAERRTRVAGQLDSAAIALENLKLDLLKLRSSGVQAALDDVNMATREARALSKDISHVLDAAAEVRAL